MNFNRKLMGFFDHIYMQIWISIYSSSGHPFSYLEIGQITSPHILIKSLRHKSNIRMNANICYYQFSLKLQSSLDELYSVRLYMYVYVYEYMSNNKTTFYFVSNF